MDAVLEDHLSAPIDDAHKALFSFIAEVNAASNEITEQDVDRVREAGWSDEAIYDAVTVAALFRFYNTWIDATGVSDMSPEAYRRSGAQMAAEGYARGGTEE